MAVVVDVSKKDLERIAKTREDWTLRMRSATQSAMRLVEVLTECVVNQTKASNLQEEYVKLLDREAKKHARHYEDIADFDMAEGKITFRDKEGKGAD